MTSPGVEVRPIELIDGGFEVNEVWFTDVRVPLDNLVGEENRLGTTRSSCSATSGSASRRSARRSGCSPRPRSSPRRRRRDGTLLDDPLVATRIAELENELLALELTALRVVAHSADGKPHPASSVLKLKGTELQQAVTELVVDLAGPASLATGAGDDSDLPWWTRRATPIYLNFRKASIYGGSNEVQRQIIARTILGL